MDLLFERCAGIDIGKRDVKVCVRTPSRKKGQRHSQVRTFYAMTDSLAELVGWLADQRVEVVAMESTGPFWKPVYYVLERAGICQQWLVNARAAKRMPGRKTDVSDARWLAELAEYGLVTPSLVPSEQVRRLRDLTRQRTCSDGTRLTHDRTRARQRLHNVLEDAGIKLSCVLSDIFGASGRAMLNALIAGQTDPEILASLARGKARRKHKALTHALKGHFTSHHATQCTDLLDQIDHLNQLIDRTTTHIQSALTDRQRHLRGLLATIPGVSGHIAEVIIAEVIIAEIGGDITPFPTAARLASWAGMCPGNNESAGRHHNTRTRKGNTWLRGALTQAAAATGHTHTWLGGRYHHLAAKRGKLKALVATGHKILTIAWHMINTNTPYRDLGPHHTTRHDRNRRARRLIHQLNTLGLDTSTIDLTPLTEPA